MQGVGYRYFAQRAAVALGITGWVRNESEGQVRALLQHADVSVLSRVVVASKHGPPRGWVQDCEVTDLHTTQPYSGIHRPQLQATTQKGRTYPALALIQL